MIVRKIIAVDVDLTVVDTLNPWLEWYDALTGHDIFDDVKKETYNLEELMHMHPSPLDYWKKPDLYDDLVPMGDSVEILKELSDKYDIIFVSSCFPEHITSKELFLQKYFSFHKGFISTHQKQYAKCDIFIDDYIKHIDQVKKYNPECLCILHKSDMNEGHTWVQIRDIIGENVYE